MRIILAITATFAGAFLIVGLTASTLEAWASARRTSDQASMMENQRLFDPGSPYKTLAAALPAR